MTGRPGRGRAGTSKQEAPRLHETPYFGRIDFKARGTRGIYPVYIGIHSFVDPGDEQHLVHDGRAPIASMFNDFELGEAFYNAPAGRNEGELVLKRQYRISKGELVFMLDTSLNIHDVVLLVVATAHLAKGLEFDQVVVPFCSATNYHTRVDRHMLYVACTRAMHQLTLTHTARLTPFLAEPAPAKAAG